MPMHNYECTKCDYADEEIVSLKEDSKGEKHAPKEITCPKCGAAAQLVFVGSAKQLTTIIPAYPGSLKKKAGYCHTHGDRPATKVQSGYGGCSNPS